MNENRLDATILRRPDVWAGLIIAVTTLVRFAFVATNQLDLVQDEAQYWDWSRRLQLSYYSKGPLVAYINYVFTGVFGNTELGVRFGAVLGSLLTQIILYLGTAKLMRRPLLGVWALFIANTAPLFLASGILMTTDNPMLVCWLGALFSLYWAGLEEKNPLPWLLLGLCLAVGVLAKYMMLAFLLTAALYAVALIRAQYVGSGFAVKLGICAVAGTVVGFLPIFLWNMNNDFVGFRHVAGLAGVAGATPEPLVRFDRLPEYIGSQIGLLTPWWLWFLLFGAWKAARDVLRGRSGESTADEQDQGPDKEFGFREKSLLAAGFWPLWLFFIVWSFHTRIQPNWSAMSYAAGLILAADGFLRFRRTSSSIWTKVWPAAGLAVFLLLHTQQFLPLPDAVNPALRLKGWEDLGHKLEALQEEKFEDPSKVFFFSDSYDMTASLAFYAPGQPRTYTADFGRRMSQYDLWPGPENKKGWNALYVRKNFRDNPPEAAFGHFEKIETVKYRTSHKGKPARKFTIFICYNFNGDWPEYRGHGY